MTQIAKPSAKNEFYLNLAIKEALQSSREGGIPIGAVLVKDGRILASGHNRRVQDEDPLAHAEITCIRNAGRLKKYRGTILYSTLMPCFLCAGAIIQFGIKRVVVGESRNFSGARTLLEQHGVSVADMDNPQCYKMLKEFIMNEPELWNEDIGK